jgi:hypothetical protein
MYENSAAEFLDIQTETASNNLVTPAFVNIPREGSSAVS